VPPTGPSVPAYVDPRVELVLPVHVNLNLNAEYRYSKILSFWIKLNNITNSRYYEWAFYPSQGLMFMLGIKYSL
jgi:outer membrane receptor protein involved in Fe transport